MLPAPDGRIAPWLHDEVLAGVAADRIGVGQRTRVDLRQRIARRARLIAERVGRRGRGRTSDRCSPRRPRGSAISSCCTPDDRFARPRDLACSGSTAFPAGANTPVVVLNRALLEVGTPVSSLAWTTPSMFASVQHDVPVQVPLLALEPNVSLRHREQAAEIVGERLARLVVVRHAALQRRLAVAEQIVGHRDARRRGCRTDGSSPSGRCSD